MKEADFRGVDVSTGMFFGLIRFCTRLRLLMISDIGRIKDISVFAAMIRSLEDFSDHDLVIDFGDDLYMYRMLQEAEVKRAIDDVCKATGHCIEIVAVEPDMRTALGYDQQMSLVGQDGEEEEDDVPSLESFSA